MYTQFLLADAPSLADLRVFLSRAVRIEDGSVRLVAADHTLAVYVAVLYPMGLLDAMPTVLGLRTFALADPTSFDAVVPVRSLIERLERAADGVAITLPMAAHAVRWAAISPPRGGWLEVQIIPGAELHRIATAGIAEVARGVPTGTGEQLMQRVRSEVWGRPIDGFGRFIAGGAFAALSLGFLAEPEADEAVRLLETGSWMRLTTRRGHVLTKHKNRSRSD